MISRNDLLDLFEQGKISGEQRYQLSWLADKGIDVSAAVTKPLYNRSNIGKIVKALENGEDVTELINACYEEEQNEQ